MRMRSALMVKIYEKQLKLSNLGKKRHSAGEVVNYIAVDVYRMGDFPMWFHFGWSCFVQLFLSLRVLFSIIGFGVVHGFVPLIICGLLNVPFPKAMQNAQLQFMAAQDKRLRSTSEILNNKKVIKLQSWEEKFKKITELFRETEFRCAPLDAATIFTILAALRTMSEPIRLLPDALTALTQVKVSFDQINSFLVDDELKDNTMTRDQELEDLHISIQDGNIAWDTESHAPTLKNINLEVKCGQKGAGKYPKLQEIQTSWIQSGTIQDNILYGKPMNRTMYEKAIKACALDKDIEAFKHGDLTEIGQRGLNMSGGHKQRIQLALAVYNDADIYLLDDQFSAVDAHTATTLFNHYIIMSIPQDSSWRGAAAFFPQPVNENGQRAAWALVDSIYYYNVRCNTVTAPLANIEYRSSDGD
ncbi:putative ABC-type xenobiotic transporter [Tanacetum coccineum]